MKSFTSLCWVLLGCCLFLSRPTVAQTDPALKTAVLELLDSYLNSGGPSKAELGTGSDLANWAVLKGVGIPALRNDPSLRKGNWSDVWSPVTKLLTENSLDKLRPLQVLTYWEESVKEPERFVRLLGRENVIDPKVPAQRNKGRDLRVALGKLRGNLKPVRASARFEDAGWRFTATSSLTPGERLVRVAITGSQPCKVSGAARTLNLNLKGRLFENRGSSAGLKVQLLDQSFSSKGCELDLKDHVDANARLAGGGEAKISCDLNLVVRDELVTGRFQIDLVSRQTGVALLTGRAVYTLRGTVNGNGELSAKLIPVSRSGSRVLRQSLEEEGTLSGSVTNGTGKGSLKLPVLKDPVNWESHRAKAGPKRK